METVAIVGGALVYIVLIILGIIITLSPYLCWRTLKEIKKQQSRDNKKILACMDAMQEVLVQMDDILCQMANARSGSEEE